MKTNKCKLQLMLPLQHKIPQQMPMLQVLMLMQVQKQIPVLVMQTQVQLMQMLILPPIITIIKKEYCHRNYYSSSIQMMVYVQHT